MKKTIRTILIFSIFALLFGTFITLTSEADVAYANGKESPVYSRLTDGIIAIYEEDVALSPVITSIPDNEIDKLAAKYGFSVKKTKALIILSDLSYRMNDPTPFTSLAEMKDREIIRFGRHLFDLYGKTLSKEERSALKAKTLKALKE